MHVTSGSSLEGFDEPKHASLPKKPGTARRHAGGAPRVDRVQLDLGRGEREAAGADPGAHEEARRGAMHFRFRRSKE